MLSVLGYSIVGWGQAGLDQSAPVSGEPPDSSHQRQHHEHPARLHQHLRGSQQDRHLETSEQQQ